MKLNDYTQYDNVYKYIDAEIIADSQYAVRDGKRLTTVLLTIPLIVMPEITRHRIFSFCIASNRAIPTSKIVNTAIFTPFFRLNKSGMQPKEFADNQSELQSIWVKARNNAVHSAILLDDKNVAKELANRLLHPFQYVKVLMSGTSFSNFFALRNHQDAQFELQVAARKLLDAYESSTPKPLKRGEWHLPFILEQEKTLPIKIQMAVSVARCARTSYKLPNSDKLSTVEKDVALFKKLLSDPLHASPFELVATPRTPVDLYGVDLVYDVKPRSYGNYDGWVQLRSFYDKDVPFVDHNVNELMVLKNENN